MCEIDTQIKALKQSIILWTWLKENPSKHKHEYREDWYIDADFDAGCPICDIASGCTTCCMQNLWPNVTWSEFSECCTARHSVYEEWLDTLYDDALRKKYAQILLDAFKKRLMELQNVS